MTNNSSAFNPASRLLFVVLILIPKRSLADGPRTLVWRTVGGFLWRRWWKLPQEAEVLVSDVAATIYKRQLQVDALVSAKKRKAAVADRLRIELRNDALPSLDDGQLSERCVAH